MKGSQKKGANNTNVLPKNVHIVKPNNQEQAPTIASFWQSLSKKDKNIFYVGGYLPDEAENELLRLGLELEDLDTYVAGLDSHETAEFETPIGNEESQEEKSPIVAFWNSLSEDEKANFIENKILSEDEETNLFAKNLSYIALELYVEDLGLLKTKNIHIENPQIIEELKTPVVEVKTEPQIIQQVQEVKQVQQAEPQVIQQVQQVTQNVTVTVEQPKQDIKKLSLTEKLAEAQKIISISQKKEQTENKLKELHNYLYAIKDGDSISLKSLDNKYSFFTNNADLVKKVSDVIENFLKGKITEFNNELEKIQIA